MITCRELLELLCDFHDGELSVEQCQHVELHLSTCRECSVTLETYRLTVHLARKLPCKSIPPDVEKRLKEKCKHVREE